MNAYRCNALKKSIIFTAVGEHPEQEQGAGALQYLTGKQDKLTETTQRDLSFPTPPAKQALTKTQCCFAPRMLELQQ